MKITSDQKVNLSQGHKKNGHLARELMLLRDLTISILKVNLLTDHRKSGPLVKEHLLLSMRTT